MLTLLCSSTLAFVPYVHKHIRTADVSRTALMLKKQPDEAPEIRPEVKVDINSSVLHQASNPLLRTFTGA